MGAAAELDRLRSGSHDADDLAVLLAEKGDGACLLGLGPGHLFDADRRIAEDRPRDHVLDPREFVRRDRGEVAEVEAQTVGRDERSLLLHVFAEHGAQRPVEQVRRRVIAPDRLPALDVDRDAATSAPAASTPVET